MVSTTTRRGLRVALVYPPFGPTVIPSLGLAVLQGGVKSRGVECRTFYWNLDIVELMPGVSFDDRLQMKTLMTSSRVWPLNEWVFTPIVYGDGHADFLDRGRSFLDEHFSGPLASIVDRSDILSMRDRALEFTDAMAERLAPYDVIGFSTTFAQNMASLALATRLKARFPEKMIVFGGGNCDGPMGQALLESFEVVDHVMSGEVDHAFPDLIVRLDEGLPTGDVPGLLSRDGTGRIVAGPPAGPLVDMDGLPFPDFDDYVAVFEDLGLDRHHELCIPLESSRGCWWGARKHCTFCGLNAEGMGYRQKSQDRFAAEIEAMVDRYGSRHFFLVDTILSMDYYDEFMEWSAGRGLHYYYAIKANIDRPRVESLADAGVDFFQPGIESLSSPVLSLMRKGVRGIQNVALLKHARELGIIPTWNILADFPGEDPAWYREMNDVLHHLVHLRPPCGVWMIQYHRFSPYHTDPAAFGLELRPHPLYEYLYPFDESVLERLVYRFERTDAEDRDLSYLDGVRETVDRWKEHYSWHDCPLTWREDGDGILIDDRRPGHPRRLYRLRGFARDVFRAIDGPRGLRSIAREAARLAEEGGPTGEPVSAGGGSSFFAALLEGDQAATALAAAVVRVRETEIAFDADAYASDPEACLDLLVDPGLAYHEEGRYLALPVHADWRPVQRTWFEIMARM